MRKRESGEMLNNLKYVNIFIYNESNLDFNNRLWNLVHQSSYIELEITPGCFRNTI